MAALSTFAALHHGDGVLVLPNAWDVASALMLADAGFPAIGTTSLGVTAAAGLPDGAGAGREITVALAGQLVSRLSVPLTVDLEGGYADDPAEVAELATELADLGVAGINLEDGVDDGGLRSAEQHAAVIAAVVSAAPGLFVNARTDSYWLKVGPESVRLEETTRRLAAYRDAGAAGVFVPGLSDLADIAHVTAAVDLPLNVLWSPSADLTALAAAGVARVSTGSTLYRQALGAALAAAELARSGDTASPAPVDYDRLQERLSR
jgi:2-methylisocitrate lyase-like PEP mutase family enzyme